MTIDRYGNAVIKKDFWTDGTWYAAFFFLPALVLWLIVTVVLIYGAYFTFRYEIEHLKAGFFFIIFAFLAGLSFFPFLKSVWALLTERMIFTDERIIYRGFGSYSVPYQKIKRVVLREREGLFGAEQFLFFAAADEFGKETLYLIPRWRTLAGGVLAKELSQHMKLNLIDLGLLSFYAARPGREWLMAAILSGGGIFLFVTFLVARASPGALASITVFLWLALAIAVIVLIARYLNGKRPIVRV